MRSIKIEGKKEIKIDESGMVSKESIKKLKEIDARKNKVTKAR